MRGLLEAVGHKLTSIGDRHGKPCKLRRFRPEHLYRQCIQNRHELEAMQTRGLGDSMPGLDVRSMTDEQTAGALRGW